MANASRLRSLSSPLKLSLFLIAMTGLAAACSGKNNSDDDDDGGDSGNSGDSGSSKGGTSGNSSGGTSGTTPKGGSSGTSGTGGGGSFVSDCSDVCDRMAACPDNDPASCADDCSQFNTLVSSNICKTEIEGLVDCANTTTDPCNGTGCETVVTALGNCLVDYCTANPTATFCQSGQ